MSRVAILFDNFGPYHRARLTAASSGCELLAIEVARRSGEYAWDVNSDRHGFRSECLFEGTSTQLDAAAIAARLEKVFGLFRPQVVVVPGWASRAALGSVAWCLKNDVPLVVMSESQENDESRSAAKEFIKRQVVSLFTAALVGGTPHANYMAQLGMSRERIFLGYDAVDNDYFSTKSAEIRKQKVENRKQFGLPEHFFIASARFIEKKNLPRLLEAYAQYWKSVVSGPALSGPAVPWSLVLLGDGPLRAALCSLIADFSLQDSVLLPGFKQYPDLPTYYGLASAFIHASTTEQWGLVVNEAMASSLPVLVSNRCGCALDLVQEGVNGFTFDPYDVDQLAQLMLKISALPSPPQSGRGQGEVSNSAPEASTFNLQPSTTLAQMGQASAGIIANWGPERFASGLKAAMEKALETGPIKPTLMQRAILQLLLRR